ncbi:MAG: AAA family ATPase [Myxococcales bacterium]|nr:AAA family ATPase [Myxococcales bacterium]
MDRAQNGTSERRAVAVSELYRVCDPTSLGFETTRELDDDRSVIGQARAIEALEFGVGMRHEGYNLFVLGSSGLDLLGVVRRYLTERGDGRAPRYDWCYVHNFKAPHQPRALSLPPSVGSRLKKAMAALIEELQTAIPAAFESDDYRTQAQEIEDEFSEQQRKAFTELQERADEHGMGLIRTPVGFAFAPKKGEGVIRPEDYEKLDDDEKERIEAVLAVLQKDMEETLRKLPRWRKESRQRLKRIEREVATLTLETLIDEVRQNFPELPAIDDYLTSVKGDILDNLDDFKPQEQAQNPFLAKAPDNDRFKRYEVNVLVDQAASDSSHVFYEDHPAYVNLIGRIEHVAHFGNLKTDFTLIKPGALHRANGGFLVLDARKVLTNGFSWEALKRALTAGAVRIESLGQQLGLVSTVTLEPEEIPLELKVVLVGDRMIYYLLHQHDPDFARLFKVAVDFEEEMERSRENDALFARLVATLVHELELRPFSAAAVARVIEHAARMAADAERLSTHTLPIADLLREADYWAGAQATEQVEASHVQRALDAQHRRLDRVQRRMLEAIERETVFIDTTGERVGQINGLAVFQLGELMFGRPSRITATVRLGKGEVVDIEREVDLGGALHSKAVLIISSLLGSRYGRETPLSFTASLVFEQSYGRIDGDSASVAELVALLSALADLPIRQSLAVTGSLNQRGDVQPIGGVNEKIEGFFDVCRAKGLSGGQGVLIPEANTKHLMLRRDVVEAVEAGTFAIYAVRSLDQALELLTGVPAGDLDAEGRYPAGSANRRVADRIATLTRRAIELARLAKEKPGDGEDAASDATEAAGEGERR